MKLIDIIDFYYASYSKINLTVEINHGIKGTAHLFSKEEALAFLLGWKNDEIANIIFQTCYTTSREIISQTSYPLLYILLK